MFRKDKHGRTWMLWRDAPAPAAVGPAHDPLTDGLDGYRERFAAAEHYGVERLLDDTLAVRTPFWDRLMRDVRTRAARALLDRSGDGRAFVMTVGGEHRLVFVSDHADDDHELAVLLRAEIDRLLKEEPEYRSAYQYV